MFEDFDFDKALQLSKDLGKAASQDLLLANLASDIERDAAFLVYEVKCKIHRSISMKDVQTATGLAADVVSKTL